MEKTSTVATAAAATVATSRGFETPGYLLLEKRNDFLLSLNSSFIVNKSCVFLFLFLSLKKSFILYIEPTELPLKCSATKKKRSSVL